MPEGMQSCGYCVDSSLRGPLPCHSLQVREKAAKARSKVAQNALKQSHAQRQEVQWVKQHHVQSVHLYARTVQVYDQPCCPSSHTDYGGVCRYTQCGLNFPSQNSTLPIFFSPSLPLPLSPSLPISLSPYLPLSLPSLPLPPPLPSPHAGSTGQKGGEDKAGEGKVDGDGPRHSTETRGLQGEGYECTYWECHGWVAWSELSILQAFFQ